MSSNIFFKRKNITIDKIFPNIKLDKKFVVKSIKPLIDAGEEDITFFDSVKYKDDLTKTKSQICITSKKLENFLPKNLQSVVVKNVLFELARVTKIIYPTADIDFPN